MLAIEIKGKMKAGSHYAYGVNMFSIYQYLIALLNRNKIQEKKKLTKEDTDFKFGLLIKRAEKFGERDIYYINKTVERAVDKNGGLAGKLYKSTMLDFPRMFYHFVILLENEEKLEEALGIDVLNNFKTAERMVKEQKFLGFYPNEVKIRNIKNIKQGGGYVVWSRSFENFEDFFDRLDRPNEDKTKVFPTVTGYAKVKDIDVKTVKNGVEFDTCFTEPMLGLVNVKSVYQLKEVPDFWFKPVHEKDAWFIATDKDSKTDAQNTEHEELIL